MTGLINEVWRPKLGGFSVKEVPLQGTASNLYTSKEYPFKRGSFNA